MGAPKGNDFWKLRKDFNGEDKKLSVEEIFIKSQEYVNYCLNNPLIETDFRGKDATSVQVPKMRAMNQWGLCHYLGICTNTLKNYKKDQKYLNIITQVEQMMFAYKFEGAAAGMLHSGIIARELGLADRQQIDVKTEQPLFSKNSDE